MSNEMFEMVKNQKFEDADLKEYFTEIDLQDARQDSAYYKKEAAKYKDSAEIWCYLCIMSLIFAIIMIVCVFATK